MTLNLVGVLFPFSAFFVVHDYLYATSSKISLDVKDSLKYHLFSLFWGIVVSILNCGFILNFCFKEVG